MTRSENLHGNAPDKAKVALLLIDVINDLEWPGGENVLEPALRMAEQIMKLKQHAQAAGGPGGLRERQLRPLEIRLQYPGRALPE